MERLGRDALDRLTPLDLQRTKKDIEHQNGVGRIRRRPQDGMTLPILSQRVPKTDVSNRRFESGADKLPPLGLIHSNGAERKFDDVLARAAYAVATLP